MLHQYQMLPQCTLILESPFTLLALYLLIALLLLFLFLLLFLVAPLPLSVYLATMKMICECSFIFEIILTVAVPELYCRR